MSDRTLLVDSHIFVWMLYRPDLITDVVKKRIQKADTVLVSRASLLELTFKHGAGKFAHRAEEILQGVEALGVKILEISDPHLAKYAHIVLRHKDPFDRLLIAQTVLEGAAFVTADRALIDSQFATIDAST